MAIQGNSLSMNEDNKKLDEPEYYQGVLIEKLPTVRSLYPTRCKAWKKKSAYTNLEYKRGSKFGSKLKRISKVLGKPD